MTDDKLSFCGCCANRLSFLCSDCEMVPSNFIHEWSDRKTKQTEPQTDCPWQKGE